MVGTGMGNQSRQIAALSILGSVAACALLLAQSSTGVTHSYSAENTSKDGVRIDLIRWSTFMERYQIVNAWTNPERTVVTRGGSADNTDPFGSFRRAGAADDDVPDDATLAAAAPPAAARAGKGKGKGVPRPPQKTPVQALHETLAKLPTVGYIWTSEVAGYSVKYAARIPQLDGGEHLLILTGRPMADSTDPFSVLELHLPAKGLGEGKAGKLAPKSLELENYNALPVSLKSVRKK
jgi:hypothetical protein